MEWLILIIIVFFIFKANSGGGGSGSYTHSFRNDIQSNQGKCSHHGGIGHIDNGKVTCSDGTKSPI